MIRGAILSTCGRYRYLLSRTWSDGPTCLFVMLNPSTADALEDDPTIRRCIAFAKSWGFGSLVVLNLFAYRATNPRELLALTVSEARGPEWNRYLFEVVAALPPGSIAVCGWGAAEVTGSPWAAHAILAVLEEMDVPTYCLARTKSGAPGHPLYLPSTSERMPYP